MEETPQGRVFLTVHVPPPRLVITGAVHISQALAPVAQLLGYDVTIVDPRTAFARPERFPDVKLIAQWPDEALPPLGIDRYTAFVASPTIPRSTIPRSSMRWRGTASISARSARRRPMRGASSGSRRKACRRRRWRASTRRSGLRIGAVSPPEIAVSIMGEITASLRLERAARRRGARAAGGGRRGEGEMKFGAVAPAEAKGGIVVHSIRKGGLVLRKGTVVGDAEIAALDAAGVAAITVARLEPGDVSEDKAAAELAAAVRATGVQVDRAFTGRANLFAETAGVVVVDNAGIDRFNEVDADITLATLAPSRRWCRQDDRDGEDHPVRGRAAARGQGARGGARAAPLVRVAPCCIRKVGVISTMLPGLADKVIEKTLRVTRSGSRRRAPRSSPSGGCRTRLRRSPARSTRCSPRGPSSSSCSAPPRSPTGATSSRPRSKRSAAPSSISACRSIPAT